MWRVASQRAVQLWRDAEHLAELSSGSVCYETTIADLMNGQHSDPLRVVMFNTDTDRAEEKRSHAIAQEILRRLGLEGRNVPSELEDFIDRHAGRDPGLLTCVETKGPRYASPSSECRILAALRGTQLHHACPHRDDFAEYWQAELPPPPRQVYRLLTWNSRGNTGND